MLQGMWTQLSQSQRTIQRGGRWRHERDRVVCVCAGALQRPLSQSAPWPLSLGATEDGGNDEVGSGERGPAGSPS